MLQIAIIIKVPLIPKSFLNRITIADEEKVKRWIHRTYSQQIIYFYEIKSNQAKASGTIVSKFKQQEKESSKGSLI